MKCKTGKVRQRWGLSLPPCVRSSSSDAHTLGGPARRASRSAAPNAATRPRARRDITDCQLAVLPPQISLLTSLHRLDAHSNRLTAVPPELGRLTAVNRLSLHSNELVTLAEEVGDMSSLQWLCAPRAHAAARALQICCRCYLCDGCIKLAWVLS